MRTDVRLGLGQVSQLLMLLGNPHKELKYVHVAGTNGKGSTCAMLSHVLTAAGHKTGLFTSPYISSPAEMISINNTPISGERLDELIAQISPHFDVMEDMPTEFEILTAVALLYFHQQNCDIVIMEVGMGGRLDATNIIPPPIVSIITPIGMDHTEYLGTTIEKIATEKSGIIKRGTHACFVHPQTPAVEKIIRHKCHEQDVTMLSLNGEIEVKVRKLLAHQYPVSLQGPHQIYNATAVLLTIVKLQSKGFKVSNEALYEGLANTKFDGRFEILQKEPAFIVDVAHNVQSVEAAVAALQSLYPEKKVTFIFGVLADKDYKRMTEVLMPLAKQFFTVTPDSERALPASELAAYISTQNTNVVACESIEEGVKMALKATNQSDVICALGSSYLLNQVRNSL
ncbi:MAG: bifunctional folylpolyglutamate synthase/dihydrofolate synthase [Defluviitaleaceae bacterium]|nr:bifunctional folylpolyglutamate synthase/dihydrofolate synthase [Defluviitaleaceae bacterium]